MLGIEESNENKKNRPPEGIEDPEVAPEVVGRGDVVILLMETIEGFGASPAVAQVQRLIGAREAAWAGACYIASLRTCHPITRHGAEAQHRAVRHSGCGRERWDADLMVQGLSVPVPTGGGECRVRMHGGSGDSEFMCTLVGGAINKQMVVQARCGILQRGEEREDAKRVDDIIPIDEIATDNCKT